MTQGHNLAALSYAIDGSLALLESECDLRDGAAGMLLRSILLRRRRALAVIRGWQRREVGDRTLPPRSRPRIGARSADGIARLIEADQHVIEIYNRLLDEPGLTLPERRLLEDQRAEVEQALLTMTSIRRRV